MQRRISDRSARALAWVIIIGSALAVGVYLGLAIRMCCEPDYISPCGNLPPVYGTDC